MSQSKNKIDLEAIANQNELFIFEKVIYWIRIRSEYSKAYFILKDSFENDREYAEELVRQCNDNIKKLLAL